VHVRTLIFDMFVTGVIITVVSIEWHVDFLALRAFIVVVMAWRLMKVQFLILYCY